MRICSDHRPSPKHPLNQWFPTLREIGCGTAGTEWAFPGDGGPALEAPIGFVAKVTADNEGNVYGVDPDQHLAFKVGQDGILHVIAGHGIPGFSGDGGPARNAALRAPRGIALDNTGLIYISDTGNGRIRTVDADGIIRTIAGAGFRGLEDDGIQALDANLRFPWGLTVAPDGSIYFGSGGGNRVRRIGPDGTIMTVAGDGTRGFSGDGGPATAAQFGGLPADVAVDAVGNVYIVDSGNHRIRRVDPNGIITTFAGDGELGFPGDGGPATEARLDNPTGVAVDSLGNVYIADGNQRLIRRVTPDGVINSVAGNDLLQDLNDGGLAIEAKLELPEGVFVDARGVIYIADTGHQRVRRVTLDGVINTIAGNGLFRFNGDGGPAVTAALNGPNAITTDRAGNLFISDFRNQRIRRVSPDGLIDTYAGSGASRCCSNYGGPATGLGIFVVHDLAVDPAGNLLIVWNGGVHTVAPDGIINPFIKPAGGGFSGDGGPALDANVGFPRGGATDALGNFYLADTFNHRIRRVDAGGIINTIAGSGDPGAGGFAGDGGPAINARLNRPDGVAADAAGNVYIADARNRRIRLVGPGGTISTFAGTGAADAAQDGALRTEIGLALLGDLLTDSQGNVLFIDSNQVFRIGADGVVRLVAGSGRFGFGGDGGLATGAAIVPSDIALDNQGNLYISDGFSNRVRVVLAERPGFLEPAPARLSFEAQSAGARPEPANVELQTSVTGMAFTARALTSDGADWLTISDVDGFTPRLLAISADPTNLAPGSYQGQVVITLPEANPMQRSIPAAFTVSQAEPPTLAVDVQNFSFTYPRQAAARSETFMIFNNGSGALDFSIEISTESGGDWLAASPTSGQATPNGPAAATVTADLAGLAAGTYRGLVTVVAQGGQRVELPVTMTVSDVDQAMLLSQSGLSFTAVAEGGVVPPQSFGVLNLGTGSMDFSISTCPKTAISCDWLKVSPTAGSSNPRGKVPEISVDIDQAGLAPGAYFGLIEVRAPTAANSPQVLTVFLDLLPAGADTGAALGTNELVFTSVAGPNSPSAQEILVYNVASEAKSYRGRSSLGRGRIEILPRDGQLDPARPTRLIVQPFTEFVEAGDYQGEVALQFSDGRVRQIDVSVAITESANAAALSKQQGACVPTKLLPAIRTLGDKFAVSAGWPVGLQVDVRDDCGGAMESGSVVVEFSNGDPELGLTSLRNGRWDGTWQTSARELSSVTLRIEAGGAGAGLRGVREVQGALRSIQSAPVLPPNGVTGSASFIAHQPLAPGSLVSLFGLGLSDGQGAATALPLPELLRSTSVFIAGRPMPLLFSSDGQVNAMVPYGLSVNTSHQILVARGPTLSRPVSVDVAGAQPAVFRTNFAGTQGHIYKIVNGAQILADSNNPAAAGDVLVLFAAGLGEVDPAVEAGVAAGASPLSRTIDPLSVTVGGQPASVFFSGLAPGFTGLYQVNITEPSGVATSDETDVVLEISGQTSPAVTIATN